MKILIGTQLVEMPDPTPNVHATSATQRAQATEAAQAAEVAQTTATVAVPPRPSVQGTSKAVANALLKGVLRHYLGNDQRSILLANLRGEESQYFCDLIAGVAQTIAAMPKTGQTDEQGNNAIVHLHYFASGACNWFITEKDAGSPDDKDLCARIQAFGYADLGDPMNAEFGYISIAMTRPSKPSRSWSRPDRPLTSRNATRPATNAAAPATPALRAAANPTPTAVAVLAVH